MCFTDTTTVPATMSPMRWRRREKMMQSAAGSAHQDRVHLKQAEQRPHKCLPPCDPRSIYLEHCQPGNPFPRRSRKGTFRKEIIGQPDRRHGGQLQQGKVLGQKPARDQGQDGRKYAIQRRSKGPGDDGAADVTCRGGGAAEGS